MVIGGVGRQKLIVHTPGFQENVNRWHISRDNLDSPRLNEFQDLRILVDSAVIHNDDQILFREGIHIVQKVINKPVEKVSIVGALNNVAIDKSISQG